MPEDKEESTTTEEPTTPATANAVADHVSQAATGASSVAQSSGESAWNTVATELKGLRDDIKSLLTGKSVAQAETTTEATTAEASAPAPEVEVPEAPVRYVRRNGRKVKRRG